ncbi:small integral membrane protein 20 isoform X2 [Acinonyx jubatus]|uniref:Small integral membrane protein 20 isoform X2 n=1 Tax=Acinonyx jubatus TaxID=32536 RepID=A0ABM3PP76_ACIJB|nr:small integral membrane protein 20 isoform X2 [Acinonyx jubatus]
MSRNLRTALIFGGFISLIGAAFYPIYFRPLMRLEEYHSAVFLHFQRVAHMTMRKSKP